MLQLRSLRLSCAALVVVVGTSSALVNLRPFIQHTFRYSIYAHYGLFRTLHGSFKTHIVCIQIRADRCYTLHDMHVCAAVGSCEPSAVPNSVRMDRPFARRDAALILHGSTLRRCLPDGHATVPSPAHRANHATPIVPIYSTDFPMSLHTNRLSALCLPQACEHSECEHARTPRALDLAHMHIPHQAVPFIMSRMSCLFYA